MDDLSAIEKRALELAEKAQGTDELLKSVQILNAISERRIRNEELDYGDETSPKVEPRRKRWFWKQVLVPIAPFLAIVLTALTLLFQGVQFFVTSWEQRQAKEDSEWRDAMKTVSLDRDKALIGALEMQSFFGSDRYGPEARSIASTSLPFILERDGFDMIFFSLHRRIDHQNQHDLVGIARHLALDEHDLFKKLGESKSDGHPLNFQDFVQNPNPFFSGDNPALSMPDAEDLQKEALARSWEISSVSEGLRYLWGKSDRKKCEPAGQDLSGIILEDDDFSEADFTGVHLTGTYLWNISLVGANLNKVKSFDHSDWYNTKWWKAKTASCDLAGYLKTNFRPRSTEDQAEAERVASTCTK